MNDIAFLFGNIYYLWHGAVIALALAAALMVALSLAGEIGVARRDILIAVLIALPCGVVLSRLLYWWCSIDKFSDRGAFSNLASGGYALYGAFAAVLISAAIVSLILRSVNFGALLDVFALSGSIGICIGRLSAFFSIGEDLGQIVENDALHFFPYAVYDQNVGEWLMAVFVFEALASGIIFAVLSAIFCRIKGNPAHYQYRNGDFALLFLLYFGCSQAFLESLRSDSLYFSFLGLVRVSQVFSAIIIIVVLIIFSVRVFRTRTLKLWLCIPLCVVCVALLTVAFLTEFLLNSETLLRSYCIMSGCLLALAMIGTLFWRASLRNNTVHYTEPSQK